MPDSQQSRSRFVKHEIARDVAARIEDELRELETTDPPPEPPKETYTFADVLRGNFELLESIKNKRHKTEVISDIFRKHNLNVTPASISAYMSRIRRELRKKEEAQNGYLTVQNKKEVKKKARTQVTAEVTVPTKENEPVPQTESNNTISVAPVNTPKEEITIVRNELHNEDVNTSVTEPCNGIFNADVIEPVKPLVTVQTKRKDNF